MRDMCRHFVRLFGIVIFGVYVRYQFAVDAELLCGRNYALSGHQLTEVLAAKVCQSTSFAR